ncbi:MAG: hypothetical protein RL607_1677 [Bacteroidota bacterium]|jgi:2-amino-4-hydroxy-6-hydroxymethyldihydropteridine diphosphokinase
MNSQHQIVLALGTNAGERLSNLEQCVHLIHEKTATVIAVSPVYETASWGFESAPFYNCIVVVHSHKTPQKILKSILKIEQEMGRIRSGHNGYEDRIIDIDIISFGNEIVETDTLTIPHPLLAERNFVLQPLAKILPNWTHPKTKQSLQDLIRLCTDSNAYQRVAEIKAPLQSIRLEQCNYIAIEGNIGAGKTTLATKMAEDFNAKTVYERFADNPFLPKFYKDQNRYAFPLEMSFLADRYQQISDDLSQFDLFKDFVVADYHIFKSLIFAKVTLAEDEFRLYKTLFDIIYKEMPKPDLYIYLYQNTERLLQNIRKRGRSYEQEIPADYLEKINNGYLDFIKTQQNLNVLVIDVSELDFVKNQNDYLTILEAIQKQLAL